MTFSVTGHCETTGMLGVAITTSSICVASRCPWARPGVGAVSTQNITDPTLGNTLLDKMAAGQSAPEALSSLLTSDTENLEYRQIALIDANGGHAAHSGDRTLGVNNVSFGNHCVAAGNLLDNPTVTDAMAHRFNELKGTHLADRLLTALEAGLDAGGEGGQVMSAGLLVVDRHPWPLVDLRCDWAESPIRVLRGVWEAYEPQMDDYVTRALDPASAPAYGVPGDP